MKYQHDNKKTKVIVIINEKSIQDIKDTFKDYIRNKNLTQCLTNF